MLSRRALVATALSLLALPLSAARPLAQQFVLSAKDRARLIAVDFTVIAADSRPVGDLRADEVTLKVDGRTRPILSLEYVGVTTRPDGGLDMGLEAYGSNAAGDEGRSVVLVVDQETIRPGRETALKSEISAFLRMLDPRDRVALMTVPHGGLKVDLTTDHPRIIEALAPIMGQAPTGESEDEAACRTNTTLSALRGTLDDLRGGEAPVTVVFFSSSLSAPAGIVLSQKGLVIGRCQVRPEQFKQVSAAAAGARAQFYVVQPQLLVEGGNRAGLEHLTGVTGGPLLQLGGGDDSALARIARETGGYYIARLEPESSETNGMIRNLDVSVSRPDVTVRQRPQMSVARPTARAFNATPSSPLEMMKEARLYHDLPLRVTGYASREPEAGMVRVVALFDSPDPSTVIAEAMIGLFDASGRMVASRQLDGAELVGSPIVSALSVPPGHYRLRVAASESGGRSGAADHDVTAELATAGPLSMSALVMGLSRQGRFLPKMEFGSESTAMAYFELYGAHQGQAVGSVFELAHTANGPALLALRGVFEATSDPDRFIVTAALPIGALPPGDYVVRATVAAEGLPGGRILRAIRKISQ